MVKSLVTAVVALVIGLAIGFVVGRWTLERQWSQPFGSISPSDADRSAAGDSNPTPKAGTRVIHPMPITRARKVVREMTAKDPAVVTVGAIGSDEVVVEAHLVVENRGKCKITALEGVGYGFDAWGQPAKANKSGESYFAFAAKDQNIEPGTHATVSQSLKHIDTASLVVAHVDKVSCADGTTWARQ